MVKKREFEIRNHANVLSIRYLEIIKPKNKKIIL